MSDFDEIAPAALRSAGMQFGEGDLEVLRVVAQALEPAMRALDAADLAELPLEGDVDPSRAPRQARFS
jgi:hypothetical protein